MASKGSGNMKGGLGVGNLNLGGPSGGRGMRVQVDKDGRVLFTERQKQRVIDRALDSWAKVTLNERGYANFKKDPVGYMTNNGSANFAIYKNILSQAENTYTRLPNGYKRASGKRAYLFGGNGYVARRTGSLFAGGGRPLNIFVYGRG